MNWELDEILQRSPAERTLGTQMNLTRFRGGYSVGRRNENCDADPILFFAPLDESGRMDLSRVRVQVTQS
jgi:hypothetical protein